MARSLEVVGLTMFARELVRHSKITEYVLPVDKDEAIIGRIFELEDGTRLTEIIDRVIWNSGRMVYTCLVDYDGKEWGKWKDAPTKYTDGLIISDNYRHGYIYVPEG